MKIQRGRDTWRVRRRVLPWRRRLRRVTEHMPDLSGLDLGGDDPISAILGFIAVVVLIPFLIALAFVFSEVLLLLLLVPFYLLFRVTFRRPWAVDVVRNDEPVATEFVRGWRFAGERAQEIGDAIRTTGQYRPAPVALD